MRSPRHTARFLALAAATVALASPLSGAALRNGPMLGDVSMRHARVWVQTTEAAEVRVAYWKKGDRDATQWAGPVATDPAWGHTATVSLAGVEPGNTYRYAIELDGERLDRLSSQTFDTQPYYFEKQPPPDVTIALGAGHYRPQEGFEPPYKTLGAGYNIFATIAGRDPDAMVWLGDTMHLRPSDWASRAGYVKRNAHARAQPEMRQLLAGTPNYATWSSADYGPEGAGRLYGRKRIARGAFEAFWANPEIAIPEFNGIATRFRVSDAEFFLLDTRSARAIRTAQDEVPQVLGDAQIRWLSEALQRSDATFKIVGAGAPILNPADKPGNLSYAKEEHNELLRVLRDSGASGLVFVSSGKTYGELTRYVQPNSYALYDLTLGPLTSAPKDQADELNYFRQPGKSTFERHFALLEITGPEDARELTMRVIGTEGEEKWSRTLKYGELRSGGP